MSGTAPASSNPNLMVLYDEARHQSEWLRMALSSIGDAVISTDADGGITFMNGIAESLTGWPVGEANGRPLQDVFEIINEQTRLPVDNPALRALREGTIFGLANHTILIARDGTERPIDDSAAPMRDEAGEILGAILVFRDVTERKKAEIAQARLAAIVASSDDAIISKTIEGIIQTWNVGAQRLFGYTAEEALGRPITMIIPQDRLHEERSILSRLVQGERIEHFETVRVTKDGRLVDISLTVSPLLDGEGRVVGASKVARDITESKRAVREQHRLGQTLGLALSSAELGTWDWDPDTDLVELSPRAAEIYGVQPGVYIREWMRSAIHPDHRDQARLLAAQAVLTQSEYDVEYPLDGPGPEPRWVSARGRGVYDADGKLVRMLGIVQDITPRKRAENALLVSEKRHRFLADLALKTQQLADPAEIMSTTAKMLVEHLEVDRCAYAEVANESHFIVLGDYSPTLPGLAGEWPVAQFGTEYQRLMLGNEPFVVNDVEKDTRVTGAELPAYQAAGIGAVICVPLHKAGRWTAAIAVQQKSSRIWTLDEVELVETVVGRCWEALERARVARTLAESRAQLAVAFEQEQHQTELLKQVADAALTIHSSGSLDSLVRVVAEESKRILGARAVVATLNLEDRTPPTVSMSAGPWNGDQELPQVLSQLVAEVCETNQTRRMTSAQVADQSSSGSDGDRAFAWQSWMAVPFISRNGRNLGVIQAFDKEKGEFTENDEAIMVQLAHIASVAIENAQLYGELREEDRRKDEFLAVLAHELRNPLAPLRNGLQILQLSGGNLQTEAKAREMMDRQLSHMVRLIDDLLDISRISRNKMELRRSRVLLADVINSAIETCRPLIEGAEHELTVTLLNHPVYLDADLTRLAQIFGNLLTNSAKYTPHGGRISLSATEEAGYVIVKVQDTGIGIPQYALNSIFNMFSQVDRSIERSTGGLGIGLALVKGLVEMHGGTVEASSAGEGLGSTFAVRLPTRGERDDSSDHDVGDKSHNKIKRRILVVDDNQDAATSMAMMLALLESDVKVAHDGVQAIEIAEHFHPQLILMDVGMPRLNGYDATRRIREQPWGKQIAIIALTGWGQDADKTLSREAGCNGHLVKPVNLLDLQRLLTDIHWGEANAQTK